MIRFIDRLRDAWRTVGGEDGPMVTITPAPHRLLSLQQWNGARSQWPAELPVGVIVPNDVDVETLAGDLPRFALVALEFPKWADGRAYSQARLLRVRLGFRGELRAVGEVLVDMMPMLARTGFDSAVLRTDQKLDAAERALAFFPGHYQGDVRNALPLFALPAEARAALTDKAAEFVNAGAAI